MTALNLAGKLIATRVRLNNALVGDPVVCAFQGSACSSTTTEREAGEGQRHLDRGVPNGMLWNPVTLEGAYPCSVPRSFV